MMAGKGYGRAGGGAMMAKKLQFRCIDGEKEGGGGGRESEREKKTRKSIKTKHKKC